MNLTQEQKRRLYAAGQYQFPVPPVTTVRWDEDDWIAYIDNHSGWKPILEVVIYREGNGYHWSIAGQAMAPDEIRHEDFDHDAHQYRALKACVVNQMFGTPLYRSAIDQLERIWERRPLPEGFALYMSDHGNGWQWVYVKTDGPTTGQIFYRLEAEETDGYQEVDDAIAGAWEHAGDEA